MAIIPKPTVTMTSIIDDSLAENNDVPRDYLGASSIGDKCERKLFYSFRNFADSYFPSRVKRIFRLGHILEEEIVSLLRSAGFTVWDTDRDGKQYRFKDFGGHFSGGCDGVILGLPEAPKCPHLLEIKTYNKARFEKLKKDGVQESDPKYWYQMQIYMSKFKLSRGVLVAYCKDNSEIHTERVYYDPLAAGYVMSKAKDIIFSRDMPPKAYTRETHFMCKMCEFADVCWRGQAPKSICKTCTFSRPQEDGSWLCMALKSFGEICEDYQAVGGHGNDRV